MVLVSEPYCLCGVDILAPFDQRKNRESIDKRLENFKKQFSESEVRFL